MLRDDASRLTHEKVSETQAGREGGVGAFCAWLGQSCRPGRLDGTPVIHPGLGANGSTGGGV